MLIWPGLTGEDHSIETGLVKNRESSDQLERFPAKTAKACPNLSERPLALRPYSFHVRLQRDGPSSNRRRGRTGRGGADERRVRRPRVQPHRPGTDLVRTSRVRSCRRSLKGLWSTRPSKTRPLSPASPPPAYRTTTRRFSPRIFHPVRHGRTAVVTEDVLHLTGAPPQSFRTYAREHAPNFKV